ncbi:hypothetical protein ACFXPM_31770 [Streptomyces sp. NPDC059095]|uniref:terpene synthase family protein n=1 Tax=Streptomyces sp. NPDC059095 TaxID=3346726 RepID=UPI0036C12923
MTLAPDPQHITLDIPALYCPLPHALHPEAQLLEERGLAWMRRFGFATEGASWNQIVGNNCGEYLALAFPSADPGRLQLFVDWTYLFFAMDDIVGDEGGLATDPARFADLAARTVRTMEVPDAQLLPAGIPFVEAVRDLTLRTRELATPAQFRRYADAHPARRPAGRAFVPRRQEHTMTDNAPQPAGRTALLKAVLAAAGLAFFIAALVLDTRWPYVPGAVLLAASVLVGRRKGRS